MLSTVFLLVAAQTLPDSTLGDSVTLPMISLFYLCENDEVIRSLVITVDERAEIAIARREAESLIGKRPSETTKHLEWHRQYSREELPDGAVGKLLLTVLGDGRVRQLREFRRRAYTFHSPELHHALALSPTQTAKAEGKLADLDRRFSSVKAQNRNDLGPAVVRTLVAERGSERLLFDFAADLTDDQQKALANEVRYPVKSPRDVVSPLRSAYHAAVRLLLVPELRVELDFSLRQSQELDSAFAEWRDEQEREYRKSEERWTPFKTISLGQSLKKCDAAVQAKIDATLTEMQKRRFEQVIVQLRGLAFAFSSDGAKKIGVTKEQMENWQKEFADELRGAKGSYSARMTALVGKESVWSLQPQWKHLTERQREKWLELIGKPITPLLYRKCHTKFVALGMQF